MDRMDLMDGWSFENALDLAKLMKKLPQRLLAAIERAGRRVSAEVLQENAHEEGKTEKTVLPLVTHCSEREAS